MPIYRDPTPAQFGFKWEPSTKDELKNFEIREQLSRVPYPRHKVAFWNEYLPSLERLARGEEDVANPTNRPPFDSRFRGGIIKEHARYISTGWLMTDCHLQILLSPTSPSCGCWLRPFPSYWWPSFWVWPAWDVKRLLYEDSPAELPNIAPVQWHHHHHPHHHLHRPSIMSILHHHHRRNITLTIPIIRRLAILQWRVGVPFVRETTTERLAVWAIASPPTATTTLTGPSPSSAAILSKPEERAGCSWRRKPRWLVWDGRGWTNWIRNSVWQKSYIPHWGRSSRVKCLRGVGCPIITNHSRNCTVVLSRPSIQTLVGMSSSSLRCDWLSFSFDGTIIVIVWLLWFLLSFELFSTINYVSQDVINLKSSRETNITHTSESKKKYLKLRKRWKLLKCQWSLCLFIFLNVADDEELGIRTHFRFPINTYNTF